MSNAPRIWVTQTVPRAYDSAKAFEALGLEPVVSPLLSVVMHDEYISKPIKDSCLIFTARNGVRAFAEKHSERDFPVITVGSATAELARNYGFEDVQSADGTALDVIDLIAKKYSKSTQIRHCSGRHVRGRIVERLLKKGYNAERVEYYASKPVTHYDIDLAEISYVTFYSPLGADTFAKLYSQNETGQLKALSISLATDKALCGINFKKKLIADTPNQAAMLAKLRLDLQD